MQSGEVGEASGEGGKAMTDKNQIMLDLAMHMEANIRKEVVRFMDLCDTMDIQTVLSTTAVQCMFLGLTMYWFALTSNISEEEVGEMCKNMLKEVRAKRGEEK